MAHENETENDENVHDVEETLPAWKSVWRNNKGVFFILISECFGACMDAIARFMQQGGVAMHPFQIMFFRMGITFVLSSLYMWWTSVPNFPLGQKSVRGLLVLRSICGFVGLFCLYYSVHYLPLAEATVFRFLVPILTAWACSIFLDQIFTRKELIAGIIALLGVVIIAHPAAIFGRVDDTIDTNQAGTVDDVTPTQRIIAIVASLVGIFGASGAYTSIRVIGNRAHALISVNYFAFIVTVGSTVALLVIPGIGFVMPQGARQWIFLVSLGVFGFALQFLLTAGLQLDKSPKATSMMYMQVIFALAFDWAIWGVLPGGWSFLGGGIVCASTLWSALQKSGVKEKKKEVVDEESALLGAQAQGSEEVAQRRGNVDI
ncbi:putative membrane protein [Lachnellula suecica]|uniref:Putative membrane protein n=1 Tax=Lachnellula suecica TaxID=602035 RepID=A0A8T9C1M5_9HELO|nr:putative membrane protein [Lachnellula suecica]